jgi:predicted deacylase
VESISIRDFALDRFAPGSRNQVWLDVQPDLFGPVRLPALVARGAKAGRTVLAIAGIHGDEYEGMEAIRLGFSRIDPATMHGAFIGIPVANPFAYAARARTAPMFVDGLNLARVFPGDPSSSPSRSLARTILEFVRTHLTGDDLLIDFHSGSADVAFAPLVGFRDIPNPGADLSAEACRHFGSGNLWCIPDGAGPLNAETSRLGIPTIGTETTGRAGCRKEDVDAYIRGIHRLLAFLRIVPGPVPSRQAGPFRKTVNVNAASSGFLRCHVELHQRVSAGEELGHLVDPFGTILQEIVAPVTGEIWAARSMPPVRTGELMYMIASETLVDQPS